MRISLPVLLLALSIGGAKADTVYFTVTPDSGSLLYEFTLENTGATGGPLYDLFLSVPLDIGSIETATIGAPMGWGDSTGGLLFFGPDAAPSTSFIQWAADFSGLYDVGVGSSLTGFSFTSSLPTAGPIMFALNGSTTFEVAQEVTPIPEPSNFSLIMIAACLALVRGSVCRTAHAARKHKGVAEAP